MKLVEKYIINETPLGVLLYINGLVKNEQFFNLKKKYKGFLYFQ